MLKHLALTLFGLLLVKVDLTLHAQSASDKRATETSASTVNLQDGTAVVLRFAEPLVGIPQFNPTNPIQHAKRGDLVHLVVASDVWVDGVSVIRKGSLAQATVMKAGVPNWQYEDSGLELRFDWVKSVDGKEIPLRQKQNAKKSGKFPVVLLSSSSGSTHLITGFSWEHRSLSEGLHQEIKVKSHHQWTVVPAGTRVKAYIQGNALLDSDEVRKALAELPEPNPTAAVTIYREKGPKEQPVQVSCDEKDLYALQDRQYLVTEMGPGKHTCRVEKEEASNFSVSAGEEIYLRVHHGTMSGKWQMTVVDAAAGEDAITFFEAVNPQKSPTLATE
jgi:hypothetical protein